MHASHSRTWRCKRRRIHVSEEEEDTCTHHTVAHGDANHRLVWCWWFGAAVPGLFRIDTIQEVEYVSCRRFRVSGLGFRV